MWFECSVILIINIGRKELICNLANNFDKMLNVKIMYAFFTNVMYQTSNDCYRWLASLYNWLIKY